MFELRHLNAFVAIAEELHFGRAARRLNMTQPPLSQLLRQLEAAVGTLLVRRTTRSVELTAAGDAFLARARVVLREAEDAAEAARRAASGEDGRIAIGFVPSAAYEVLPRMIRAYRADYPRVRLDFAEMTSLPQADALRRGRIDVALLRPPVEAEDLAAATIWRESLVAALPAGHRLTRRASLRVSDLQDEAFIAYDEAASPYFSRRLQDLLDRWEVRPSIVQRAILPSNLAFVEAGVGIALVPASARRLATRGMVFRRLAGTSADQEIELLAAWRRSDRSPLIERWIRAARPANPDQRKGPC